MKEQWEINKKNLKALDLEKGLQERKQEYETSCCKQWLRYIKLIFLLEIMLFLGWGCYMILETYRVRETQNEVTNITHERYPIVGSLIEVQKSHSSREMPEIVKPEVIDELNNFLEDMKLTKTQDLMQDKAIVVDVDSMVQSSVQNPINMQNNNLIRTNDVSSLLMIRSSKDDSVQDEFKKNSMPWKTFSTEYGTDRIINTDKDEESVSQFIKKLGNIIKNNNLEKFENEYEDSNRLMLDSQKNNILDTSNILKILGINVTIISNIENFLDRKVSVSLTNSLQNSEQKFSDSTKDVAQNDYSKKSSFSDKTDKEMNAHLEPDLVMCPPYQSHESSDMSSEHSNKTSSISQVVSTQENSEQIENASSDGIAKDEDKHDINDSNMLMSASSDASVFGNIEHFTFDILVPILSDIEAQPTSERSANIKEDKKYASKENIKNIFKIFPKTQDNVKSITPNVDIFQWYNAPARFADDLFDQSQSNVKSSETSFFRDENTYKDSIEIIDPNSENKCFMNIIMDILKIECPGIKFDEEWNLTSSENNLNVDNIYDYDYKEDASGQWYDEFIFVENPDKNIATLQLSIPKVDAFELQESPSVKASNDASLNLSNMSEVNFDSAEITQNNTIYSSNEKEMTQAITTTSTSIPESDITVDSGKGWNPLPESSISGFQSIYIDKEQNPALEISVFHIPVIDSGEESNLSPETSDTQRQEQLKITEKQNFEDIKTKDIKTLSKTIDALEKKLISLFNIEMSKIINLQYPLESSSKQDYFNNICSFYSYICSSSKHLWPQQYDNLKTSLEHIPNDYNSRKKRMTNDVMWQQEQILNALEENNKNVDILENLRKLFQKMEILAAYIDKLHERYLLYNKLDDDYISSEFPIETEERQEFNVRL